MSRMLTTETPRVRASGTAPLPSPPVTVTLLPQVPPSRMTSLSPSSLAPAVRHHQQIFLRQYPGRFSLPSTRHSREPAGQDRFLLVGMGGAWNTAASLKTRAVTQK